MKTQVWIIHGGDVYASHAEYIRRLKNVTIDPERLHYRRSWKATITDDLGEDFDVLFPDMPNRSNAKYEEWKLWFEKHTVFMQDDHVLVGHSLGGLFLAKYLSENTLPSRIKSLMLIAAPSRDTREKSLGDFKLPQSLENVSRQTANIELLHSRDDKVVSVDQVYDYSTLLPSARLTLFDKKGHFNDEHFPELVKKIKSL